MTYSNETYLQTNARLVRTGQSYNTIIYRLVCPGTIDDAVCEALRTKSDTQTGLFTALKALQEMKKSFKFEIQLTFEAEAPYDQ